MHTKKLRALMVGDAAVSETEATAADQRYSVWAELIQVLDKRSVMMLKQDCKGDGIAGLEEADRPFRRDRDAKAHEPPGEIHDSEPAQQRGDGGLPHPGGGDVAVSCGGGRGCFGEPPHFRGAQRTA